MTYSATAHLLCRLESMIDTELPERAAVLDTTRVIEVKRRDAALIEGTPGAYIFVVRSGLLKQCYTSADGNEWIKSFTGDGDLFGCPTALRDGGRATFSSIAIEDSLVERVDFAVIEALADRWVQWQKGLRSGFQRLVEIKIQRERDLLSLNAEQLYRKFLTESPQVVERIPQRELAAYLGVTPVGLNRIVQRARRALA